MSRIRAFLTHLSISAIVMGVALAVIFLIWYPAPYFEIAGAGNIVRLLITVHLIAGPLLTLILFRSGKPGLVFDLCCVALVQVSALTYGLSVIYSERPYYVVFAIDRFEVLARKEVDESAIADDRLKQKPWAEPIYAVASLPESMEAQQRLIDDVLKGKPDIERRPELWSVYSDKPEAVLRKATPLAEFSQARPDAAEYARQLIDDAEIGVNLAGLPVVGKDGDRVLVIETDDLKPVGLIPVDPWAPAPATNERSENGNPDA